MLERGTVVNNADPTGRKRVTLHIPRLFGDEESDWAPPLFKGIIPPTGSTVWVMFHADDTDRPVYVPAIPSP